MSVNTPAILVLGAGNLLLCDEGFGVHVVQALAAENNLPRNVTLLDGGTLGPALLDSILSCDYLILVDVTHGGLPAGTLTRRTGQELLGSLKAKQSAHEWSITEILLQASLIGHLPNTTALLVEPQDMSTFDTELTPLLAERVPVIMSVIREEIRAIAWRDDF